MVMQQGQPALPAELGYVHLSLSWAVLAGLTAAAGCETTTFVASFDFVGPGALQAAQNVFALDKGVLNATLGGVGVGFLDHLELPANVVLGTSPLTCTPFRALSTVLQARRNASTAATSTDHRSTSGVSPSLPCGTDA